MNTIQNFYDIYRKYFYEKTLSLKEFVTKLEQEAGYPMKDVDDFQDLQLHFAQCCFILGEIEQAKNLLQEISVNGTNQYLDAEKRLRKL